MINIKKFNEIIDGWSNLIIKEDENEILAKQRLKICVDCLNIKKNNYCGICGCYIPAKVRSKKSECPKQFWLKKED